MKDIKKKWQELSKQIDGQANFKEDIQSNIQGYVFSAEILKEESKGKTQLKQSFVVYGDNKYESSLITLTYNTKTKRSINFQIWKKGFIEKIFNSGLKTGEELIDQKYCIKSTTKRDALMLLKIPELREYLLTKNNSYFNIDDKKEEVKVTFRVDSFDDAKDAYKVLKAILRDINI